MSKVSGQLIQAISGRLGPLDSTQLAGTGTLRLKCLPELLEFIEFDAESVQLPVPNKLSNRLIWDAEGEAVRRKPGEPGLTYEKT